jgi:hypothetical protein
MEIRLSRHARNKLRLYKLAVKDVEETIVFGERSDQGNKWESRREKLRIIWVRVGSYTVVITIIKTK